MRYWICRTPGKVEGPFERSALESMLSSGELTEDTQICPEGSETWQTFGSLIESEAGAEAEDGRVSTPPTEPAEARTRRRESNDDAPIANLPYSFSNSFVVGWKGFTEHYGLLLGVSFIVFVASILPTVVTLPLNIMSNATNNAMSFMVLMQVANYAWSLLVVIPLTLGGIWVGIKIARGEDARFSDVWFPYQRIGWIILGALLLYVLMLIIYLCALICGGIPGVIIGFLIGLATTEAAAGVIIGASVGLLITVPIILYGLSRVILMMVPIIDPKLGRMNPPDAMQWALRNTKHGVAWSLVGLFFVVALMMSFSFLILVLPYLFFALPLSQAVWGAAYALIASKDIDDMLCQHCGYTRLGTPSPQCPECGKPWNLENEMA